MSDNERCPKCGDFMVYVYGDGIYSEHDIGGACCSRLQILALTAERGALKAELAGANAELEKAKAVIEKLLPSARETLRATKGVTGSGTVACRLWWALNEIVETLAAKEGAE